MKHKHRIKPGYEGGEYVEGNVVVLSPTQHAMWHFAEWQRKQNTEDFIAWRAITGLISSDEAAIEAMKLGGQAGARWNKDPANKEKKRQLSLGKRASAETRQKMRESHKTRPDSVGDYLRKVSPEQRRRNGRKGLLNRWGWHSLFPQDVEYRTALSETFVLYATYFGLPDSRLVE